MFPGLKRYIPKVENMKYSILTEYEVFYWQICEQ